MLQVDPNERISFRDALSHPFFANDMDKFEQEFADDLALLDVY